MPCTSKGIGSCVQLFVCLKVNRYFAFCNKLKVLELLRHLLKLLQNLKMDLNETKRKRSVPEWMKSPLKSSPTKSIDRGNRNVTQKVHRPSYPPIAIKKRKQLPRPLEERLPCAVKGSYLQNSGPSADQTKCDKSETSGGSGSFCNEPPPKEFRAALDDFSLTVDELTRVAQEVINEDRQRKVYMQARVNRMKGLPP